MFSLVWGFAKPYVWPVVAGVAVTALVVGAWQYQKHVWKKQGEADAQVAQLKVDLKQAQDDVATFKAEAERSYAVAQKLEGTLAEGRQRELELNGRLKNAVAKNDAAWVCGVPADGVLILRDARADSPTSPAAR